MTEPSKASTAAPRDATAQQTASVGAIRDLSSLNLTVLITGAAVMVVELLDTRVIGPVFGVGLFTWSALLSVTLLALATGYYYGGVVADRGKRGVLGRRVLAAGVLLALVVVVDRLVLAWCEALGVEFGPLVAAALLFGPTLTALGIARPIATRQLAT